MTWFRVGGGGVPDSLKNRMNAVLNKKYRTFELDYPPNEWPDDVNLLGLLPEGTASGAIANIIDGADRVPTKNVIATIAPTLTGVSSVVCTQIKKNLIDNSANAWESGTINSSGVNASGTGTRTIDYFELKGGETITVSGIVAPSTTTDFRIFYYDENKDFLSYRNYSASYIVPDDVRYIRIRNISVSDISALQIEYGSEATTYQRYSAPTVYSADLGRTIYGGTADLVTGEGVDGYGLITFDGSADESWQDYSSYNGFYIAIPTMKVGTRQDGVTNYLTNSSTSAHTTDTYWLGVNSNRLFLIEVAQTMGATIEDLRTYLSNHPLTLAYPLAAPTDFTFTGQRIETMLGVNNFWNDADGDTSVTYRRDIDLALQAASG